MKTSALLLSGILGAVALSSCSASEGYAPRNGDIIFQESRSSQSLAIQLATGSRYSHMGIVYVRDGAPFVFEAVQPVKTTPLAEWVARGEGGHFVVKRLENADEALTPETLNRMAAVGEALAGLDYDLYFEWTDARIYCSELVWKVYERAAGIRIGELQRMRDFDLSSPAVEEKMRERFGDAPPLDETVISPEAIFSAPMLETVFRN